MKSTKKFVKLSLAAAVIAAGATLGVTLAATPGAHAETSPNSSDLASGYMDKDNGDYLRIALSGSMAGEFAVAVPGTGLVWPNSAPATVSVNSDHSYSVRYNGAALKDPDAVLDPEFGARYQQVGQGQPVTLKVIGQIDPTHNTASVEIWIDGAHVHLGSIPLPGATAATAVATAYLAALKDKNWDAAYALFDSDLRGAISAKDFSAKMAATVPAQGVVSGTQGTPAIGTTPDGINYAKVPLQLTFADGSTQSGTVELVVNGGSWKILTVK